jgi:agmatinase
VGADVVEVSPTYDSAGQITALVAANVVWEMMALAAVAARLLVPTTAAT